MAEPPLIAVVEIPKGGRNKYEYDPDLGGITFDRLLMSAAAYPADYGYIPDTLGCDGDVLDALVCLTEPIFPGCLIPVKPLRDPNWNVHDRLEDLPELLRAEIEQFFSIYKDLEDKQVVVDGWRSREDAVQEIRAARERFAEARRAGNITERRGPGGRLPGPQRRQ